MRKKPKKTTRRRAVASLRLKPKMTEKEIRAGRVACGLAGDPPPEPTEEVHAATWATREGNVWHIHGTADLFDLGDALRFLIPNFLEMYDEAAGARERHGHGVPYFARFEDPEARARAEVSRWVAGGPASSK